MKKKLPIIIIICVLMLGLCLLLYPSVSNLISRYTSRTTINNYQSAIKKIDNGEIKAILESAYQYNTKLASTNIYVPFGEETFEISSKYMDYLNISDIMGYIDIPSINVYLPIYHGTSPEVLKKGIGHLENTSLPVGGVSTHAILSGHSGLPTSTLFTNLDQLAKGNIFYISVLGETLAYQVDQIKIVYPYEVDDLLIVNGKDYLTLVTCTPYGINSHRLLVRGVRVNYEVADKSENNVSLHLTINEVSIIPTIFFIILPIIIVIISSLLRKKNHKSN